MKSMKSQLLGFSALPLLAQAQPAFAAQSTAAPIPAASPVSSLGAMGAVASFYDQYKPSIWFKGGAVSPAAAQLVTILRRAPIEGFAVGPQLADQVEAAVRQAASGAPADVSSAERILSTALVTYVQTLKRPTPGMIYAYSVLSPQG